MTTLHSQASLFQIFKEADTEKILGVRLLLYRLDCFRREGYGFPHPISNLYSAMRHTWIYLLALATIPFASCHDDKEQPEAPIGEKTYNASELELLYNGNAMPSKSVAISQTGNKAHVSVFSLFDLSQIGNGMTGEVAAPGAIPGSPKLD